MVTGRSRLRIVSTFSGIAGLDTGLGDAGHTVVQMCESWEPARRVLRSHFPSVTIAPDIVDFTPNPDYDLLVAGFPCTDLSHAGSKAGILGPKSGLVSHVIRIIEATTPKWVVLENVPNILSLHRGSGMAFITAAFERLGYRWAYRTVDSRFTGVPQRRPRVIFLASRSHDPRPAILNQEEHEPDVFADSASGFYWTEGRNGLGLVSGAVPTLKGGSTLGLPSAPAVWTPAAPLGSRLVLPSTEDGEELQGLPRGWTEAARVRGEHDHRWKLVGNAVTTGVGEWVGRRIGTDESWVGSTSGAETPIVVDRRWPAAGWGDESGRFAHHVSAFPERHRAVDLATVVPATERTPLSLRATRGFLSRLDESGRTVDPAFYRDVEAHMHAMRRSTWTTTPTTSSRMSKQPQHGTKPELALRAELHRRGLRYRLQVKPIPTLRRRPDIVFTKARVVVDVRGCFWHACPEHSTTPSANRDRWEAKLAANVARDASTVEQLEAADWEVVVVWEHDDHLEAADRVEKAVRARSNL